MAFTELYCDPSTGSNVNAGDNTANGIVTSTNGAWSTATNIFTATGGTPFSGVSVGDFCALMADAGTVAAYIARVTAIGGGGLTLTLSTTSKSGTAPTTAGTGITATTGGAWKGPNAAVAFPFGFISQAMKNVAGDIVRVNFKNNATYSITAAMTHNVDGPTLFEGYTTTPGDNGIAVIDGGTSGASYILLAITAWRNKFHNFELKNNGATGSATGLRVANNAIIERVRVNNVRGFGMSVEASSRIEECEVHAFNQSNTAGKAGFDASSNAPVTFVRCIAHDGSGSNCDGFRFGIEAIMDRCISESNGGHGVLISNASVVILQSSFVGNSGAGIAGSGISNNYEVFENCILVNNGTYGINLSVSGSSTAQNVVKNCAFYNNTSGQTNGVNTNDITGSITLSGTPFTDSANGDFGLNNTASAGASCRGAGAGAFFQNSSSYSATTISYPDVGAAQHMEVASAGSTIFIGTNIVNIVEGRSVASYGDS